MIYLENIWKSSPSGPKEKVVLAGVNATLDFETSNIGILGSDRSATATLLGVITGSVQPDAGSVTRRARVSWPLSWRGFGKGMTGDAQVTFLAGIYRADPGDTLRFVAELSGLGRKLFDPMSVYKPREKDRLMVATALALPFEVYVLDGDFPAIHPAFAEHYRSVWEDRLKTCRVLIASSRPRHLAPWCTLATILDGGQLGELMPLTQSTRVFRDMLRNRRSQTNE